MKESHDPTRIPAYKLGYARAWLDMPFDGSLGAIFAPGSDDAKAYEQGYFEGKADAAASQRRAQP